MKTQTERVLEALHRAGRHGVCQVDFSLPNVVDGGVPITRLAARVQELQKQGFRFRDGGRRQKCKVYVLDSVPVTWDWGDSDAPAGLGGQSGDRTGASESLQLFREEPGNAIFGFEDAA